MDRIVHADADAQHADHQGVGVDLIPGRADVPGHHQQGQHVGQHRPEADPDRARADDHHQADHQQREDQPVALPDQDTVQPPAEQVGQPRDLDIDAAEMLLAELLDRLADVMGAAHAVAVESHGHPQHLLLEVDQPAHSRCFARQRHQPRKLLGRPATAQLAADMIQHRHR